MMEIFKYSHSLTAVFIKKKYILAAFNVGRELFLISIIVLN
ncbi:hypothetical protein RCH18_002298 [Flavobacterium sp. PL11]|nr:hypothetical protein [Flavobacterium sp. PL11]